jgi:alanine-glyoxylate transaminase/serine-glyoxylate transaminase/serine-pyruvate transaminase
MSNQPASPIAPPRRILMGPGPSDIPPSVLAALGAPTVGHLDPYFLKIMDETQRMLRQVFRTENGLTLAVSGTGSAGMETCVVNLIERGDRMLICQNGVFGGRMADVAGRAGAEVTVIEREFGQVFPADEVADAVRRVSPKVVGIVAWVIYLIDGKELGGFRLEAEAGRLDALGDRPEHSRNVDRLVVTFQRTNFADPTGP